ncbi:MAG: hypothetical protein QG641_2007, partial [Candidatus Poribacteria bacterium]|nr:hypothetical protein [Candidatus Poribacteria bacterium]
EDWQIPNEIWQKVTQEEIKEISETQLGETIIRLYASQLKDLIMFGKDSFVLDIGFTSYNIHLRTDGLRLIAKHFLQPMQNMDYRVKISESTNHIDNEKRKLFILSSGVGIALNESEEISVLRQFLILDLKELIYKMLNIFVLKCYYFPASRTGILQLYRGFSANVIKQQEIPKLSSVISDFISNMIEISDKEKGFYFQFAEELSKELLKGDIILVSEDKIFIPEIKYRFKGVDIPLNRVSTSVSELAPLILYLKYIVKPGSVLIIEEPEAHLHPGNIRILAKYLVRLVKKGVNVLITTHSEYLLEQLDNFVMLSNIDPEEIVERYGYEKDDFLKHTDFAVYEFHYDQNTGTSKIEKARLTKKDGVSQEEFVKVFEELYEETDKLRRDLSDE